MQARRPAAAMLALTTLGVGFAWLFANPLLLALPVGIGGLLLTRQYQFMRDLQATRNALTVSQAVTNKQIRTTQSTPLTLTTSHDSSLPLDVELTPQLPAALTTRTPDPITIEDDATHHSYVLESEIAGRYEIPPPRVHATSRDGAFETAFELGTPTTIVVAPAGPREIHVGEGGERFAAAYGEHPAGKGGAGLDPSELRKYLPGDPTNRIDWKATARLNEPHVREFEAETDRETHLVIDTRTTMAQGPTGETKLDYARQLALAFVESASHLGDPLGLLVFDDDGITTTRPADATPTHYRRLETTLHDLTTQTPEPTPTGEPTTRVREQRGPDTAHRHATRLRGEDTAFATRLRPFLQDRNAYVQRLDDRPLFKTVRSQLAHTSARVWTILITDDTNRVETREAVKLARRQGAHVLVCLLPSILYEPGGLTDLDDAYSTYRDFEAYRRQLATIEGVRALEIGPQDRLAAILAQPSRSQHA